MAVGGDLADGVPLVVRGDGLHPLRLVVPEVILTEVAAGGPAEGHDLLHQRTAVITLAAGGRQLLQGLSVLLPAKDVPRPVGRAVRLHKPLPPVGVGGGVPLHGGGDPPGVLLPHGLQVHLDGNALPGGRDGRGKQLGQGLCPEAPVQLRPPRRSAGHHGGYPTGLWHRLMPQLPHQGGGQGRWGHAAGVQAVELLLRLHPHQGEAVRAQAVAGGLQQGHGRRHGHRRIHRVSPGLHHIQPDLGPLGNGGAGHGLSRVHHIPPGGIGIASGIKLRHFSLSSLDVRPSSAGLITLSAPSRCP